LLNSLQRTKNFTINFALIDFLASILENPRRRLQSNHPKEHNASQITRSRRSCAVIQFQARSLHAWSIARLQGWNLSLRGKNPAIRQPLLREVRQAKTFLHMSALKKPKQEFEAIHLVALGINEVKTRGTNRHAQAVAVLVAGRKLWLEKFERKCPHCGGKL
jgi:hypothetical protein